jgi:tripartite-type tricarboxylate transporter receptor subunit TctC
VRGNDWPGADAKQAQSTENDMKRLATVLGALGLLLTLPLAAAQAQTWPQRSVRFIVSLGPGSGADIAARLLSDHLTKKWKQPVVVENRPGGDAVIAITTFIGAKDDHTLLYTPTSSFTAHPYMLKKLPYDPAEMHPVARVSNTIVGLAVPGSSDIKSVKDLVAQIKAKPNTFNYTTVTGMTDLIFEGYFKSAGLDITRIPYKDPVQAVTDLAEGRIQAYVAALAIQQAHVKSGRHRLIAVTNSDRAAAFPDTPTVTQAGFPDMTFDGLVGLFGTASLPSEARARIAADIAEVLKDPGILSKLTATGQAVSPGTGKDFAASLDAQRKTLAAIAKRLGLTVAQ